MPQLGINIDHVATLRQARAEFDPDPISAAKICEQNGADSIVCHLREDRRHIQDDDLIKLKKALTKPLTLELSLNKEIVKIAYRIKPQTAVFVPEKRQEITTEGGLDVIKAQGRLGEAITFLKKRNIRISLFIDPTKRQIAKARHLDVDYIELHTGQYAHAQTKKAKTKELKKLKEMSQYGQSLGLIVNAGHGLKYDDTRDVAKIKGIYELNIGHSIIAEAVFVGLAAAVKKMKRIVSHP